MRGTRSPVPHRRGCGFSGCPVSVLDRGIAGVGIGMSADRLQPAPDLSWEC